MIFPGNVEEAINFQKSSIRAFWSKREDVTARAICRNSLRIIREIKLKGFDPNYKYVERKKGKDKVVKAKT